MSEIIKKYDFIMSIGRFCHTTAMLNNHGLKLFDGPWDWSGTGRAEGIYKRLEALTKGFNGWFNKKDFVKMDPQYSSEIEDGTFLNPSRWSPPSLNSQKHQLTNTQFPIAINPEVRFYNTKTLTYYGHDFHEKPQFNEQWDAFYKRYIRRSRRILKFIQAANSILLVYMSHIADQRKDIILDDNLIIQHMEKLRKKYPTKTIDLYIFKHSPNMHNGDYLRQVLDVGIINYYSNHDEVWPSNDPICSHAANNFMMPISICKILEKISLTDKFKMI